MNKWIKVVNRKISPSSTKHPATATNNTEHKSGSRQVFSSIYHLHFNFTFHILEPNIEVVLKLDLLAPFGLTWLGCNRACTWGTTTARLNTRLSFLSVLTWHSYWPSSRGVTCRILHTCLSVTAHHHTCLSVTTHRDESLKRRSIRRFVITEKAPTRAFSWLKAKRLPALSHLRHY